MNPLCREALLLYRTGVAPQWIQEVDVDRNSRVTSRFDRVCDYCMHARNIPYLHDAFHVLFECPLFESERKVLCDRVPPSVIRECFGTQDSLYELHVMLLCPNSMQVASAVGHFLACTIAKLGIFKAVQEGKPTIGPIHYMQRAMLYDRKWIRSFRGKADLVRNEVISLFTQPTQLYGNMRSPSISSWASQCVLHVNGGVSLGFMLPTNYIQSALQGLNVNMVGCPRIVAKPKSKAKAKQKERTGGTIIGKIPQKRHV